ncbi:MAG: hypothetical protein ACRCUJ_01755 [Phocaeicola sp.]
MKKIKLYGHEYPIRNNLGAMRRFKRMTGMEVSEMGNSIDALCTYMYCCIASACNADDVRFVMDEDKFADGLSIEQINEFSATLIAESEEASKKKGAEQV